MTTPHLCSVERKCTGHGMTCAAVDRACAEKARSDGLEVTCERTETEGMTVFVYCPPGGDTRDSSVVWILLVVAIGVAVVGGMLAFVISRRRVRSGT